MRRIESPYPRRAVQRATERLSLAILFAGLVACQTQSEMDTPPRAEGAVLAERYIGAKSTFELPTLGDKLTSSRALVRLTRALDSAYALLEMQAPYPSIKIVSDSHPMMKGSRVGVAAVTAGGEEVILFNRNYLESRKTLDALVIHEVAHIKTWRAHGHDIRPHGREFKRICRAVTARRNCTKQEG